MEVLLGALGVLVVIVLLASVFFRKGKGKQEKEETIVIPDADCCGAHEICENDLPANINDTPEYYDDEELDRFKDRTPESYQPEEEEEFMEVFLTLKEKEVPGWIKSLQIREIELPIEVREQAIIVLGELRMQAS